MRRLKMKQFLKVKISKKMVFPPPKLQCVVIKSFCFENTIYHFSVLKCGLKGTHGPVRWLSW